MRIRKSLRVNRITDIAWRTGDNKAGCRWWKFSSVRVRQKVEEEGLGSAHENLVHEYENRAFSSSRTLSHKKTGFHKLRNSISPIKENTCHYALFFIFAWDVLFFIYFNALCRGDHPPPNGGLPLCKCFLLLSKDRTLSEVFSTLGEEQQSPIDAL